MHGHESASSASAAWAGATPRTSRTRVPGAELVAACSPIGEELDWARDASSASRGVYARLRATARAATDVDAVFLVTPNDAASAQQIIDGAARRQARVLRKAAVARCSTNAARVEAEAAKHPRSQGDDRLRAPLRRELPGRARRASRRARSAARSWCARRRCDKNDPSRLLRAFAPTSRRHLRRHERARHRRRALAAGRAEAEARVRDRHGRRARRPARSAATSTTAWRICEFADGAHGAASTRRARWRTATRRTTEIIGTDGRLTVGRECRARTTSRSPTRTASARECTPTFYERFADAFLREAHPFRRLRARRPCAGADAARRHRGDAHRHRAAHVAARAARGRAVRRHAQLPRRRSHDRIAPQMRCCAGARALTALALSSAQSPRALTASSAIA